MSIFCYFVDLIGAPNTILKFDNCFLYHQSYSNINLYIHFIDDPNKKLTVFTSIFLTKLLCHFFDIHNIRLTIQSKLIYLILFIIIISCTNLNNHINISINKIMSIEIQKNLFWWLEFKDKVTRLFSWNCLKLRYSGLESNIPFFSWDQNSKMNIFIKKSLFLGDFDDKAQAMNIVLIECNIAFIWYFSFTIFRDLLLIVYSQLQFISRSDKIEMNILLCCQIESKL